jgi:hypothetical protein
LLSSWLAAAAAARWVALSNLVRMTKSLTKDGFLLVGRRKEKKH